MGQSTETSITLWNTVDHEIRETCYSILCFTVKKLVLWYYQEVHLTTHDRGCSALIIVGKLHFPFSSEIWFFMLLNVMEWQVSWISFDLIFPSLLAGRLTDDHSELNWSSFQNSGRLGRSDDRESGTLSCPLLAPPLGYATGQPMFTHWVVF